MKNRAFTLVEIMVVVGIVALLAALAINIMVRSRMNANETVAIGSTRTVNSACQSYYSVVIPHEYPDSLAILGVSGVTGPSYIDTSLASGTKSGYIYTYQKTSVVTFVLYVDPQVPGRTGERFFYTDETGRTTANKGGRAGPSDPSIS